MIKAKHHYIRNCLNDLDPSSKKYWAELNKVTPLIKKKHRDTLKTEDGTILSGLEMTEFLNDCFVSIGKSFVSIGKSLAEKCNFNNSDYLEQYRMPKTANVLNEWEVVTEIEVEVLIENMGVSKNSNIDKISAFLLKECLLCSLSEVTYLFNCVLLSGTYPDNWKLATVIPLYKGGDRLGTSNYRPISLLSALGKLMEKLIHRRVFRYLDSFKFFSKCQWS